MSRHRLVRNLDLEDEMDDEEDGMTQEEQAQMATALPIARSLLKDVRPPISDDAIADSLWHYWFDVEKTVGWLKSDAEKKGEALHTQPQLTPNGRPRRRPGSSNARATPSTSSNPSSDILPPLTALQRLSLSRKAGPAGSTSSTGTVSTPTGPSSTPFEATASPKPMSKLALLAQKRREAAAAAAATPSAETSASPSRIPTPRVETPSKATSSSQTPTSDSAAKPLSKLAQKMAAARAAREEAAAKSETAPTRSTSESMEVDEPVSSASPTTDPASDLFSTASFSPPKSSGPSSFFSIITSTASPDAHPAETGVANLHVPLATDIASLAKRFEVAFAESPDEIILRKRQGRAGTAELNTAAKAATQKSASLPGKPRTQANAQTPVKSKLQPKTQPNSPTTSSKPSSSGANTPKTSKSPLTGAQQDLAGLHLSEEVDEAEREREREKYKERAATNMKAEELVAKVRKEEADSGKQNISLIVVGHVDAGKSTLMGRLLYDIGELTEKEKTANERGSKKVGKGSFAFAWGLDALGDERDRGVTIDIATTHFATPHRNITLLDAPGHRDFIPAMISGAAQADVALMVVDGSPGEFEAGFERGGQTREHAWLVRSLGVKEIIVGVNKMDVVSWSQDRYDDIVDALKPFLVSAGFSAAKTTFMPLAAMEGINVLENNAEELKAWYTGPTLINALDKVEVPTRPYDSPLRIPLSNVFKGQTAVASGVAVSGRLCSGVVQVGDRLRAVPGDETATVRTIEVDDDSAPYAVAGQNVTLYLSGIDAIHLSIGTVLCPTALPVPLVNKFTAQILVFDLSSPIITGTAVELFHHSMNLPATISKLVSISEKGQVVKKNPRVLQKGTTATVELTLRSNNGNGNSNASSSKAPSIPLETTADNKEMGRVLIRRGGETIAAGVVLELLG
ncbi:hypothetical protein IAT40_006776 [Kwoniella sp. CBS 6097]